MVGGLPLPHWSSPLHASGQWGQWAGDYLDTAQTPAQCQTVVCAMHRTRQPTHLRPFLVRLIPTKSVCFPSLRSCYLPARYHPGLSPTSRSCSTPGKPDCLPSLTKHSPRRAWSLFPLWQCLFVLCVSLNKTKYKLIVSLLDFCLSPDRYGNNILNSLFWLETNYLINRALFLWWFWTVTLTISASNFPSMGCWKTTDRWING